MHLMLALLSQAWQRLEQILGGGRLVEDRGAPCPCWLRTTLVLLMCPRENTDKVVAHGEEGGRRAVRWRGGRVRHVPFSRRVYRKQGEGEVAQAGGQIYPACCHWAQSF